MTKTETIEPEAAAAAQKAPDQPIRSLLDELPSPSGAPVDPAAAPKRLHVSNLPFKWRENELHQAFSKFGAVTHAEIVYNDRGSKGFGFVSFERADEADRAIAALSGTEVLGRTITVNEASRRRYPLCDRARVSRWQPPTTSTTTTTDALLKQHLNNHTTLKTEQHSAENIGALLLKQKQLLAQQQLQQYLLTQQQSDLIAAVLGVPRPTPSPLSGLAASLYASYPTPYPAVSGGLPSGAGLGLPMTMAATTTTMAPASIDPTTMVYQQPPPLALLQQQLAAYGQMSTVPYGVAAQPQPQQLLYTMAATQQQKQPPHQWYSLPTEQQLQLQRQSVPPATTTASGSLSNHMAAYLAHEMAGSSSSTTSKRRPGAGADMPTTRFTPY